MGVYDNFLDLGGHSLLAMEALSKLEHIIGPALNPALFRAQTLGQVAASYDEMLPAEKMLSFFSAGRRTGAGAVFLACGCGPGRCCCCFAIIFRLWSVY